MISNKFNQFLSNTYAAGIARANRFEVEITFPPALQLSSLARHMSFVAQAVTIPAQTLATTEVKLNGLIAIPMPYSFSYGNQLNMTFALSADYRERNAMLIWQNLIYSISGDKQGFGYYDEYANGTIIVKALNYANDTVQRFIFRNCYPSAILETSYGWDNSDRLNQEVTFTFFSVETAISSGAENSPLGDVIPKMPIKFDGSQTVYPLTGGIVPSLPSINNGIGNNTVVT